MLLEYILLKSSICWSPPPNISLIGMGEEQAVCDECKAYTYIYRVMNTTPDAVLY